jgi:ABC-type nitrate/sulfonate/bicarbonate transport system permease component
MTNAVQNAPRTQVRVAKTKVARRAWSEQSLERMMNIISPLALIGLWELAARFGLIDTRFFPAPSKVFAVGYSLIENGVLMTNVWASMQRLFWGILWGGIPALILGVAMGMFRTLRMIVEPIIAATYPIPKSAILPLILLIFGLGEPSKVVMVATGVFYPILINSMAGVLEINKIHFDVSRNFGAGGFQTFRTVALPGALPLIMTGVKLGVGLGLVLIAIAEMVGAKSGLGYMIWNAWEILSVETMYVGLITIAVLGLLFTLILNEIERLIVPWKSVR